MDYKLVFTKNAEKDIEKLDREQAVRILKKVNSFLSLNHPLEKAKKLTGFDIDTYRYRVGDYRIVFRLDRKTGELVVLVVLRIAHRKEVYKKI
jgi:mRNA interferase RelE/StbE